MKNEKIDKFVNLHVHSALGSLLDSVAKIPDIVKFAKEHNQIAIALTDHGKMSGFVELYKECKKAEIKPIIGIEAYEVDDMYEKADTKEYTQPRYHLLLLAKNKKGLQNLFKIATISNTEGFYKKPLITLDYIKKHNLGEGVICSSACLASRLSRALEQDNWELAEKVALKTKSIFEEYYIEMQSHANDIQMTSNIKHLKLAKKLNIPWLISTDAHMITEDQMDIHSVFIRISQDREVGENYDGCYLQTSSEVVDKFHKYEHLGFTFQDIKTGVLNTFKIANEVEDIDIGFHQENQMPKIDIPKEFKDSNEYVEHLIWKGFEEKFKDMSEEDKEIRRQRLNEEIPVIEALHYSDYFIMLQMLTQEAKKRKIPLGYSRGSGANCLCLYCLGITQIDSVRWNLDFSRFANLGRISMADYDMDISKLRRKEMVSISEDLFGKENVAPICTFNTLSTKVAIRDIGKVLNEDPNSPYYNQIPYNIRDEVAKQIPTIKTLDDLGQEVEKDMLLKDLLSSDPKLQGWYHRFPKWFYYVMYLEGLPKSMGRHAAGTIIAPKPVVDYAPLCYDTEGNPMLQIEMHNAMDDLSLIKMDFLGLETLDIVDEALNIAGLTWQDVDINHLNLADKEVYDNIYKKGNTVSIFQMESAEARNMCIEAKADNIEDIIAINAANRPGTKDQFPDYCRNKLNPESATLIHPDLGEIFKTTNMILLYQEQALQIFRYAGFPENEVDNARRCVDENTYILMWNGSTKKIKDLKVGDKILNLGENNNIVVDTVKQVFDNGLQDTFEVRAQQTKSIIGTKDHKVLTQDGWKTIGELTTSDYVMIPKYCPNIRNNIPSNKYPCSESLFSIGALIGDGTLGDKMNIHFTNSDEELIEAVKYGISMLLPRNKKDCVFKSHSQDGKTVDKIYSIFINSEESPEHNKKLVSILSEYDLLHKAKDKHLCEELLSLTQGEKLYSLLAGLFSTDGGFHKQGIWLEYYSQSKELCEGIQILLRKCGIKSQITSKFVKEYNYLAYTLYISSKNSQKRFGKTILPYMKGRKKNEFMQIIESSDNENNYDFKLPPKYSKEMKENLNSSNLPIAEIGAHIGYERNGLKISNTECTNNIKAEKVVSEVYCPQTYTLLRAEYIPVKVTSIKPYKKTHVYDLEATNNHNYIANDIIVHNCIGKKLKDKMQDLEVEFRDLLTKKGWTEQQINNLWDLILKQTGYSFNRGHSVSYGLLSYLTAYLKYHYPVEFMTACLNVKADNISKIGILINECYNLNIEVLPPDINKSRKDFTAFPRNRQILFGLLAIKGLGDSMLSVALENRPYKDFEDFLQRSKATSKVVINFIKAGCFGKNKNELLLRYFDYTFPDRVFKPTKTLPKAEILLNEWGIEKGDRTNKDESLIREYNDKRKIKFNAEQKEKYNSKLEQFKEKYMQNEYMWEFETLSMFITDNPLKEMSHYITDWSLVKDGEEPCILAVVVDIKRKKDKNNNVFAYLDLYTVNGIIEAIAWSSKYKKYSNLIEKGKCISILGRKSEDKIFVNEIKSFEQWKKDRFIEEEN